MSESQNIEYKESWRDEYLKWICGFANAQGGKIYIGIADNKEVVGMTDAKRLMEDIPNKIVNTLGIVADVNLLEKGDKQFIEIAVEPSAIPISLKGVYHYRMVQLNKYLTARLCINSSCGKWERLGITSNGYHIPKIFWIVRQSIISFKKAFRLTVSMPLY